MTHPERRSEDVTLGELTRRLESMAAQYERHLELVAKQFESLTTRLDNTYLPVKLHEAQRHADLAAAQVIRDNVKEVRDDFDDLLQTQRQNRLLAVTGLIFPILVAVITAVILAVVVPL